MYTAKVIEEGTDLIKEEAAEVLAKLTDPETPADQMGELMGKLDALAAEEAAIAAVDEWWENL